MSDRNIVNQAGIARREFLSRSATAAGAAAFAGSFGSLLRRAAAGDADGHLGRDFRPVADEATGLPLLQLPPGFRYVSFGWAGDALPDGTATPSAHDGMGVIDTSGGIVTLCRNHEVTRFGDAVGHEGIIYDPQALGACTNLKFDTRSGEWLSSELAIGGTLKNCAGGSTPWGSWLTCEEMVTGPADRDEAGRPVPCERDHGWIFEVPAGRRAEPQPLKEMGRFVHEAVAVDPITGIVYETEDRTEAGCYRFTPHRPGRLSAGGTLQMLRVAGRPTLHRDCTPGERLDVTWVDIDDPLRGHSPGTQDQLGVMKQGQAAGGSVFSRLEGCWYGNELVYLAATSGGNAGLGQIWAYDPRQEVLELVFESPAARVLENPDNITVSPRGGIVLCEDGTTVPQRLHGLRRDGTIVPVAANNVVLGGERNSLVGDYRGSEWCGVCFDPTGTWLFANLQSPGITVAISGPWTDLGL